MYKCQHHILIRTKLKQDLRKLELVIVLFPSAVLGSLFNRVQGLGVGASCGAAVHGPPVHPEQELLNCSVFSRQPHIQKGGQRSAGHGEMLDADVLRKNYEG